MIYWTERGLKGLRHYGDDLSLHFRLWPHPTDIIVTSCLAVIQTSNVIATHRVVVRL